MKKFISMALVLLMLIPAISGCNNTQERTLNVLTWDGYIPQDVISAFEADTGIKMNFSNFNDNEEMLSKLSAAGASQYDVVIASDYMIDIAAKMGLIAELDKEKIPNFENIDEVYQNQYYDLENKYVVPYAAGTPLIVYDPEKVSVDIKGYNDLWDPQLKNSIVLLDDARNIIGITLKSMGYSFNETDENILNEAKEKLFKLKDNVHHFDYNNPYESIISGEVNVAYMFTPQVLLALAERPELKVVYPEEGMGFGIDSWFIPTTAKNTDEAHEFLNYILEPKTGANIAEQIMYMCINKASREYLSDEFTKNPALYIDTEVLGTPEFIEDVGDATAIFDKIWTEFKQQ